MVLLLISVPINVCLFHIDRNVFSKNSGLTMWMYVVEAGLSFPFSAVAFVSAASVSCQLNDFLAAKLYVFPRIHAQI